MIALPDLKTISGSDLLSATIERLLDEAQRIRECQDALVAARYREQWEDGQVQLRAALLAAAGALIAVRLAGREARRLPPIVEGAIAAISSEWIMELQARAPMPSEEAEPAQSSAA
jgi:hypothetical protein